MKILPTFIFCWTIFLVSGAEINANNQATINKHVSVDIEPTKPTIPTTTLKPTTATTPLTTTTTTTTVAPNPTTSTTTPPTTSTPKSTPAPPAPTPGPAPKTGQWVVNGTNSTCIILRMAAQFNVTYVSNDNKNMSRLMTLPDSNLTSVTGSCGDIEQVINISWNSSMAPMTYNDSLILHFVKNKTNYALHHVEMYVAAEELPKSNLTMPLMLIHNASEYQIPLSNSYRCLKLQKISLTSNMTNTTGIIEVTDLQFQAFRNEKTTAFGLAEDCPFETADYIPIAVGCGLIVLVIVVLVAYLVGRRRSQSRGYLSM